MAWANWADGWVLESLAVAAGRSGHHDAMNAHTQGRKTRATRWQIIAVSAVAAVAVLLAMVRWLPWWGWLAAAVAAVAVLARHGAPDGQPIIRAAIVPTAYQPPTPEVITRALGSLGIAAINAVIKDGPGHRVRLRRAPRRRRVGRRAGPAARRHRLRHHQAPRGAGLGAAPPALGDLARGGAARARRAAVPVGRPARPVQDQARPLPAAASTGTADVFGHVPFAANPRGQAVGAPLFETNWVIGAAPGQGKTTAVRALNCGAALDVVCDLWIHELAGRRRPGTAGAGLPPVRLRAG